MRTLTAQLQTAVALEANKPIELFEIYLDDLTLRYVNYDADVTFDTELYTAIGVGRSNTRTDIKLSPDSVTINTDNINRYFSDLEATGTEFRGKQIIIKKVVVDYLAAANYVVIFDGVIDIIQIDQYQISMNVESPLASLNIQCPRRKFEPLCHWRYGDSDCTSTIDTLNILEIINVSTDSKRLICNREGNPLIETRVDYWKGGTITITGSLDDVTSHNSGISRKIKGIATSSLELANKQFLTLYIANRFPYKIISNMSTTATLRTGCDKTKENCITHNNMNNFGGFLSIVDDFKFTKMVIE